jgi:hypothetical protein
LRLIGNVGAKPKKELKLKRKEALKFIEAKLREGFSKQEIYDELSAKIYLKSDLLQYLAMVPDPGKRIKFRAINLILFALLIFVTIVKILTTLVLFARISLWLIPLSFIIPFVSIFFAVEVKKFRGYIYRPLGLLGIASLFQGLSHIGDLGRINPGQVIFEFIVGYLPTILIIVVAFYISAKAFPYYGFLGLKKEKLDIKV